MTTEKKSTGWSSIRQQIKDWPQPALLGLVKDLHDASAANRDFLQARVQAEDDRGEALEKYRARIVEQFFPRRGFGKLKLAEARKAIRDYRKATGNLAGTAELMLTYVENGTRFTREYGDINEPFYNSLDSVLAELVQLLIKEGAAWYPRFQDRLLKVEADASHIGWGYCDTVHEQVELLESTLAAGGEAGDAPRTTNPPA